VRLLCLQRPLLLKLSVAARNLGTASVTALQESNPSCESKAGPVMQKPIDSRLFKGVHFKHANFVSSGGFAG
jgi:hypothetical protein